MASSAQDHDDGGSFSVKSLASKLVHPSGEWREKFRSQHPHLHDTKAYLTNRKHALGKLGNVLVRLRRRSDMFGVAVAAK